MLVPLLVRVAALEPLQARVAALEPDNVQLLADNVRLQAQAAAMQERMAALEENGGDDRRRVRQRAGDAPHDPPPNIAAMSEMGVSAVVAALRQARSKKKITIQCLAVYAKLDDERQRPRKIRSECS